MENVQFEEEQLTNLIDKKQKTTRMARMFIRLGLAKDQNSANRAMIIIIIVATLLAIFIFTYYVIGYNPFVKKFDANNLPPNVKDII